MLTEKICDEQLEPYCFQTNKNPFCDLLLTVDILFWLHCYGIRTLLMLYIFLNKENTNKNVS